MDPNDSDFKHEIDVTKNICRCCLSTDKRMTKIDSYRGYFIDLVDIIVSESDGLPQWLCYECSAMLLKSVRFKQKVLQAHTVLYEYHSRCVPFPIDGQDPELTKYACPHLGKSSTLVFDTSKSKNGYHKVLEHQKPNNIRKLIEIHIPEENVVGDTNIIGENDVIGDDISIKDELEFSEVDDDVPLHEIRSNKNKNSDPSETNLKEEKREKKRKVKKKVKMKSLNAVDGLDLNVPLEAAEPKKNAIRKQDEVDETKIRIITLDPAEQLKQREEESKATLKFPFQCHFCFKGFNFEEKLKNHMFKHSPARGRFKCELCSMHFPSAYSSSVHALTHTRRYECVPCGRRMADRLAITNHYRSALYTHAPLRVRAVRPPHGRPPRHHQPLQVSSIYTRAATSACRAAAAWPTASPSPTTTGQLYIHTRRYECVPCGRRMADRLAITNHYRSALYTHAPLRVRAVRPPHGRPPRHHQPLQVSSIYTRAATSACRAAAAWPTASPSPTTTGQLYIHTRRYECVPCGRRMADRLAITNHYRSALYTHAPLRVRAVRPPHGRPPRHHQPLQVSSIYTRAATSACRAAAAWPTASPSPTTTGQLYIHTRRYECVPCGRRMADRLAITNHYRSALYTHAPLRVRAVRPPHGRPPRHHQPLQVSSIYTRAATSACRAAAAWPTASPSPTTTGQLYIHTRRYECVPCGRRMADRLAITNHYRSALYTHAPLRVRAVRPPHGRPPRHHQPLQVSSIYTRAATSACRAAAAWPTASPSPTTTGQLYIHTRRYECVPCGRRMADRLAITNHYR
ncbi:unnamed protein product [Euphydryas editha]|uniref:Uncharacterized protein n=1 Tax=Euphydryas editha TaxID=104508 RepID=A0AAU9TC11_EUPED|nr:unnamed protein product [Euphydryas editha]